MSVQIKEVKTKKELKEFVKFQFEIFKGNPYFVPPIIDDEISTFLPEKNPAYEHSESKLFLAIKDGKIAGRIAAIISHIANQKWKMNNLRFGWIDFIDDYEVVKALFNAAESWGKECGLNTITGPHGFCDFDMQGLLVEGFDKLATIASYYHHPYYQKHIENYGFQKEVDFVEFLSTPPYETGIPEKILKIADYVKEKYKFRLPQYTNKKDIIKRGNEILKLLDETFEENYGTVPLTDKQREYYTKKYISFIHKDLVKLVETQDGELIGFLITMPSLSKAYQKANGHLFPFGIFHMLKALKTFEILDFYFAGVKKEYRGKGVDLLMTVEIVKTAMQLGFKYAESNQELETNTRVQAEWKFFNPVLHKRRRIYKKEIKD
ncbi:MAG: hypothetical protein N2319_10615 [Candidatus Kapabacteria bacterium]|nr:hypothetical protein [Candidatus Kapabacteria bacterium]